MINNMEKIYWLKDKKSVKLNALLQTIYEKKEQKNALLKSQTKKFPRLYYLLAFLKFKIAKIFTNYKINKLSDKLILSWKENIKNYPIQRKKSISFKNHNATHNEIIAFNHSIKALKNNKCIANYVDEDFKDWNDNFEIQQSIAEHKKNIEDNNRQSEVKELLEKYGI